MKRRSHKSSAPGFGDRVDQSVHAINRSLYRDDRGVWMKQPDGRLVVGVLQPSDWGAGVVRVVSGAIKGQVQIPKARLNGAPFGQLVSVRLADPLDPDHPVGEVVEVLGEANRPDVGLEAILVAHEVLREFPQAVLAEVEGLPLDPSAQAVETAIRGGRRDLRWLKTLTIDGLTAKDLDDALSFEALPEGGSRLYVHIADVSEVVCEGTALDDEARLRATSLYPVDRVIPMLPPRLSNGLCSLNPGKDRLTLTVQLDYDRQGRRVAGQVYESVIQSDLRADYTAVFQSLVAGVPQPGYERIWPQLQGLAALAHLRRKRRASEGRMDFEFPETEVDLAEDGTPLRIYAAETNFAHDLIETFMVDANEWVAEHFESLEAPFLYRVHEGPDPLKLEQVARLCRQQGLAIPRRLPADPLVLRKLLEQVQDRPEGQALSQLLLRAMAKAQYAPRDLGHFGLALQHYCHFTSPIRRYPDLFIHRVIKGYLHGRPKIRTWTAEAIGLAEHCSAQEREAMAVERESTELKVAEYYSTRLGEHAKGKISGFNTAGFYVTLDNTAEGLVPFRSLPDYFVFDEDQMEAWGRTCGVVLRLGQPVAVRVAEVDLIRRRVDFELVETDPILLQMKARTGRSGGHANRHEGREKTSKQSRRNKQTDPAKRSSQQGQGSRRASRRSKGEAGNLGKHRSHRSGHSHRSERLAGRGERPDVSSKTSLNAPRGGTKRRLPRHKRRARRSLRG